MRCRSCNERAGGLKRLCSDCARLFALYEQHRGELGLSQLLDLEESWTVLGRDG